MHRSNGGRISLFLKQPARHRCQEGQRGQGQQVAAKQWHHSITETATAFTRPVRVSVVVQNSTESPGESGPHVTSLICTK
jgi:hypothetical protein